MQCLLIGICRGGLKECPSGDLCPLLLKRNTVRSFVGYAGLHGKHENYNLHLEQKRLPYTRLLLILRGYSTLWKIYIPYIVPAVCKNDFPLWAFLRSCIQLGKNLPSVRLTQETARLVSAYETSDPGGAEPNDFYVVTDHHWLWIFLQTGGVLSEATPSALANIGECR